MDADTIIAELRRRHPPHRWAFLREVRTRTGYASYGEHGTEVGVRLIDAYAMSLWPSDQFRRIAYEVKISRGDFARELEDPVKRFQARMLSHEFWYAMPPGIYNHKTDHPRLEGCGVLEVYEGGSKILTRPTKGHLPMPLPDHFMASMLRNALGSNDAHDDAVVQVVKQAQFLHRSGYDGPFLGEPVEPLFSALTRLERAAMAREIPYPHMYPGAKISYVVGDATEPLNRPALIIHACNDVSVWARGFVKSLSTKWPQPEQAYRASTPKLGTCSAARVTPDICVVNMVCQRGVDEDRHIAPLPLEQCLAVVNEMVDKWPGEKPTIHCPRIGSGYGKTPWGPIETALYYGLPDKSVFVYDLPS